MIFHCAADPVYLEKYYELYHTSISHYCSDAEFSLNVLGKPHTGFDTSRLKFFTEEKASLKSIMKRYQVSDERSALGYYAFNRWISLPDTDQPLVVSDVDIAAINRIDTDLVLDLLDQHDVIQVTRRTLDTSGGVLMFILHPSVISDVREFARNYLETTPLTWDLDLGMLRYFQNTCSLAQTLQFREVTKNSNLDSEPAWFIFSKGKQRKHSILTTAWRAAHPNIQIS
jgi:hypothetical protein